MSESPENCHFCYIRFKRKTSAESELRSAFRTYLLWSSFTRISFVYVCRAQIPCRSCRLLHPLKMFITPPPFFPLFIFHKTLQRGVSVSVHALLNIHTVRRVHSWELPGPITVLCLPATWAAPPRRLGDEGLALKASAWWTLRGLLNEATDWNRHPSWERALHVLDTLYFRY